MKKIILSVFTVMMVSCSLNTSQLGGKKEEELINGMLNLEKKFTTVFDQNFNQDTLVFINDSLKMYFEVMNDNFPNSNKMGEIIFIMGEAAMKLKEGAQAIAYFESLEEKYPEHAEVPRSIYFRAYTYENVLQDVEKAIDTYKHLYKTYPDSKWAENAKSQVLYLNNPSFIGE